MYVEDIKDWKRTYTHIFAHNFLNIQLIVNPRKSFEKLRLRAFQPHHQILWVLKHVKIVKDFIMQYYMESTHYIGAHVKVVEGGKYYE